jgi:hypothetical protein
MHPCILFSPGRPCQRMEGPLGLMMGDLKHQMADTYFHIFTHLSWLAEATIPVACDWAKADITHSWAATVMHLFSAMFQSSNDWIRTMITTREERIETNMSKKYQEL